MGFTEDMEDLLPETLVHNVTFDHTDQTMEITFAHLRDQHEGLGMIKIAMIERELFLAEIQEVEAALRNLLNEFEVANRNADARKARVKKATDRLKLEDDDGDTEE